MILQEPSEHPETRGYFAALVFMIRETRSQWETNIFARLLWKELWRYVFLLIGIFIVVVIIRNAMTFLLVRTNLPSSTAFYRVWLFASPFIAAALQVIVPVVYASWAYPRLWMKNDELRTLPIPRSRLFGAFLVPLLLLTCCWIAADCCAIMFKIAIAYGLLFGAGGESIVLTFLALLARIISKFMIGCTISVILVLRRARQIQGRAEGDNVSIIPAMVKVLVIWTILRFASEVGASFVYRFSYNAEFGNFSLTSICRNIVVPLSASIVIYYAFRPMRKEEFAAARAKLFR